MYNLVCFTATRLHFRPRKNGVDGAFLPPFSLPAGRIRFCPANKTLVSGGLRGYLYRYSLPDAPPSPPPHPPGVSVHLGQGSAPTVNRRQHLARYFLAEMRVFFVETCLVFFKTWIPFVASCPCQDRWMVLACICIVPLAQY